ncbi:hypothetical protein NOV72_01360 [Caballeronia novacaledonica]|uniref:Uncharacterized protein n=1 Tax=Caballeronia novacaledonica TaxID=1544861 RepID=A0A2U3I213_9BURK|nr:hypothetical protein [Caballeronia novacaledonica]SPB14111.1 hypothetical protein NOV72_01360 [Caballeronia novacaledonica]
MASSIVSHRLALIPLEADLSNVFESDDPPLMSLARLDELGTACSNYLVESACLFGSSSMYLEC